MYMSHAAFDPRFCFEIFRRAIVERDGQAWEVLYRQYTQHSPVVPHWVARHSLFPATGEDAAYFANRAFERMWLALTPERFAKFPDLSSLLRYLKMCVHSAITDYLRTRGAETVALDEAYQGATPPEDHEALRQSELWQLIEAQLRDDRERVAFFGRFVTDMRPAEIAAQHPGLFQGVKEVYSVLQNLLKRLRRDPDLLGYLTDVAESGR